MGVCGRTPGSHRWSLAPERDRKGRHDERQEKDRQDVLSAAPEGDDLALVRLEGRDPARVPAVADFQEQAKRDINNLLRVRLKEPGMTIRYGGQDIVDLKTVDWVDITDSEQRNFRLAVDRSSHLLDRAVVSTPDETMNSRNVETNIFTNFQLMDGVRTAMQITTDRNGRRSSQVFFSICKYNSNLPPDLFTKASLGKRYSEVGSKKYKDEKKKEKEEN